MGETDHTLGWYRRQYSGFINGKRINSVSLPAEAWFWRLHANADDFGNLPADPNQLFLLTVGKRLGTVSVDDISDLVIELGESGLIQMYPIGTELFWNIPDFVKKQPAGKNGRRIHRYPEPLNELRIDCKIRVNPGESGKSGPPITTTITTTTTSGGNPPAAEVVVNSKPELPHNLASADESFARFWKIYPSTRRSGKPKCFKIWQKEKLHEIADDVIRGLKKWKKGDMWLKDNGKFVMGPERWLNERNWETPPEPGVDPNDPDAWFVIRGSKNTRESVLEMFGAESLKIHEYQRSFEDQPGYAEAEALRDKYGNDWMKHYHHPDGPSPEIAKILQDQFGDDWHRHYYPGISVEAVNSCP